MFCDDIKKLSNKTATSAGFQVSLISIFLTLLYNISICFDTKSMSSLKEARQQLVLNNFDGDIDDEELLLLFEINKSDILDLPYKNYENFDLDLLEDDECLLEFRFHKRDISLLAEALQIPLNVQMEQFNKSMSYLRSSVQWIFGDIVNYFKFIDFKKTQKIGLSTVGKTYTVSALLRNALTCLYGNTTSQFYG